METIGDYAFEQCGLTSFVIPESVTTLGQKAFYGCSKLTEIAIPDGITSIGIGAFKDCSALTSVAFNGSSKITTIAEETFYNCSELTSISIPAKVTTIGKNAFGGCGKLASVTFAEGNNLTSVNEGAFYACSALAGIVIPSGVTSIGEEAFYNCEALKMVVNDSDLTITIGSTEHGYVAYYADNVTSHTNGFTIDATASGAVLTSYSGTETDVTLPSFDGKSYSIGTYAFQYNNNITSVTIPKNVTSIGTSAFERCSNLKTVTFEEESTLTNIAQQAFRSSGIESINLPEGITVINEETFANCASLKSIVLPDSVKQIKARAFQYSGLMSVTLGKNLQPYETIGSYAFNGCDKLYEVVNNSSLSIKPGGGFSFGYISANA